MFFKLREGMMSEVMVKVRTEAEVEIGRNGSDATGEVGIDMVKLHVVARGP